MHLLIKNPDLIFKVQKTQGITERYVFTDSPEKEHFWKMPKYGLNENTNVSIFMTITAASETRGWKSVSQSLATQNKHKTNLLLNLIDKIFNVMITSELTKASKTLRFKVLYVQKVRDDPRPKNDVQYLVTTKNTFDNHQSIFQKKLL